MSRRAARRVAWGLAALSLALLLSGFGFGLYASSGSGLRSTSWALPLAITVVFSAVGGLIATRHPGNAIGWIFLGVAVSAGLGGLAGGYAEYSIGANGGSEALGKTAAWYGSLSWIPFILVPATFLLLLFPDGRLLSPRWRPMAWSATLGIAGGFVTQGLTPGKLEDYPHLTNPYGVTSWLLGPLTALSAFLILAGIAGSSVSLILRFRRATGEQRQQIKWLALAGAVAAVTIPIGTLGYDVWGATASNVAIMLSVLGLPIAAGVAILRYRLYDIDVVINRTLVYGALTATLVLSYLATVLLLQLLLRPLTSSSNLAIAGSTLAVAALFRPARRRIQEVVDRRFYRRKYDAAQTLERFGARLRDEVALESLSAELRGVVTETMQPAHVSLWLKEGR